MKYSLTLAFGLLFVSSLPSAAKAEVSQNYRDAVMCETVITELARQEKSGEFELETQNSSPYRAGIIDIISKICGIFFDCSCSCTVHGTTISTSVSQGGSGSCKSKLWSIWKTEGHSPVYQNYDLFFRDCHPTYSENHC